MGQKAIINSLHVLQNKNWNSVCYVEYNHYKAVFTKDLACYLYLRAQSKLNYNVLKRKHIYQIEIRKSLIYHTKKGIILNLHLVYLKNLKKQFIHRFIKSLLSDMKKIFKYKNNELLLSYKVGKNTALFTALKIASLIEKRIKFIFSHMYILRKCFFELKNYCFIIVGLSTIRFNSKIYNQ